MSQGTEPRLRDRSDGERDDGWGYCSCSGNDVWELVQDGKGWTDQICPGGREKKALFDHESGK